MKLGALLKGIAVVSPEIENLEVTGLQDDSRQVTPGDLFIARSGHGDDGHRYAEAALAAGAVALLSDGDCDGASVGERTVRLENSAAAMPELASRIWNLPDENLRLWGVTGTNGKTSLTFLMEAALAAEGRACGVLGTISNRIAGEATPSRLTTPGLLDLHRFGARVRELGLNDLVLEVSSHALDQGRLGNLRLSAAAFTNLTQDHLDYHGDMKRYFESKRRLFTDYLAPGGRPVINIDNPYGAALAQELGSAAWRVSRRDPSAEIALLADHSEEVAQELSIATPAGELKIRSLLIGSFNQENILLAAGWALAAGVSPEAIVKGFSRVTVPGRMQVVCDGEGTVVVDYAHTPDALERVLESVRPRVTGELVALFGCGGDRDRAKRPLMGAAAARWADRLLLTSDNPRSEDPVEILKQIEAGVPAGKKYTSTPDRRQAIRQAVGELKRGDLLLIAGKGHEDYQIIGDQRLSFDDAVEAKKAWEARHGA